MPEGTMFTLARTSGITLIELIATIVIMGIALLGVTFALRGIDRSADPLVELRAVALAQSYLDEILSKRFDEETPVNGVPPCRGLSPPKPCTAAGSFGTDGGENSRDKYDDVDDYHGLDEGTGSAGSLPLKDAQGNNRTGYPDYRVQINVRYINVTSGQEEFFTPGKGNELDDQLDAKLITLTVTYPGAGSSFVFAAYKSNF